MKTTARARFKLLAGIATCLSGCVYTPVMQSSYQFDRHPGVSLEVGWQYHWDGYDGMSNMVSTLVNRSSVDKCAWTDALDSRLLRAGETWQVGRVNSPGHVGVANVLPSDPNCANAKREHRG